MSIAKTRQPAAHAPHQQRKFRATAICVLRPSMPLPLSAAAVPLARRMSFGPLHAECGCGCGCRGLWMWMRMQRMWMRMQRLNDDCGCGCGCRGFVDVDAEEASSASSEEASSACSLYRDPGVAARGEAELTKRSADLLLASFAARPTSRPSAIHAAPPWVGAVGTTG